MNLLQKKIVTLMCLGILGISIFIGCSNKFITTKTEQKDDSVFKIGLPITKTENCCTSPVDSEQGFQTELWYEIGNRINYKVQFKSSDISELEKLLEGNEIKTIINRYVVNDPKLVNYTFTFPITSNNKVKVVQYAFKKENINLVNSINAAIKSMSDDGTIEKLLSKWYK